MTLFRSRTLDEQTDSLAHYLPGGQLFEAKFIPGTNLRRYLRALASELQRYYSILEEVATEHDILYTQNLITEWESALGIPGTCFDNKGTLEVRRRNLIAKLRYMHGSTAQDFINLAGYLGYQVQVEACSEHGMFPAAFPIYFFDAGKTVKFTMIITMEPDDETVGFPLKFPIRFIKPDNALLKCLFNRIRPANVQVLYHYGSLLVGTGLPPSPIRTLNLAAWWDFDDITTLTVDDQGRISQVLDKSGNGHHLSQSVAANRPQLIGAFTGAQRGVMSTDTTAKGLERANSSILRGVSGLTVFGVVRPAATNTSYWFWASQWDSATTSRWRQRVHAISGDGKIGGAVGVDDSVGASVFYTAEAVVTYAGPFYVMCTTYDPVTARVRQYLNGALVMDSAPIGPTTYSTFSDTDSQLLVLGGKSGAVTGMPGQWGTVAVYNTVLPDGDRVAVENYFNSYWGIA